MTHYERCVASVTGYALDLKRNMKPKNFERNAETLIESYLTQPAFYPEWRSGLMEAAAKAVGLRVSP
jgi:hypothetical protein